MMKVAYLLPSIHRSNGWRTHARGFIGAIHDHVDPILFVAAEDAEAAEDLFPECQHFILPTIQQAYLQRQHMAQIAATASTIVSQTYPDVDVIHSLEAYPTGLVGSWLALKLGRPHVLTAHGTCSVLPYKSMLDRIAYRRVLRRASALCPVSAGTADLIRQYFTDAVAATYVQPILNGNDYYLSIPSQEARQYQPAPTPTVLSVGTVTPRNGQDISLQAFALLKKDFPSAKYWIVGNIDDITYYRTLRRFVAVNRISDVKFLGVVSDARLHRLYRKASVFLLTPQQIRLDFEGFGLRYLEAGAFGLPVVGTRTGGVSSAIRHGETGFIADPDDVNGIAGHLYRFLTDPSLAQRMGRANREWAETLTWERYAEEQYAVYLKVLSFGRSKNVSILHDPVHQ